MFASAWKRGSVKELRWQFLEQGVGLGLAFVVGTQVARHLGPDRSGVLAYAMGVLTLAQPLARLGIDQIVVRDAALEGADLPRIFNGARRLMWLSTAVSLAALAFVAFHTNQGPEMTLAVLWSAVALVATPFAVPEWILRGRLRYREISPLKVLNTIGRELARGGLIFLNAGVVAYAAVGGIATAAAGIVPGMVARHKLGQEIGGAGKIPWRDFAALIRGGFPLLVTGLAVAVASRIDVVMLTNLRGNDESGFYQAALRLSEPWVMIPAVGLQVAFPRLANADFGIAVRRCVQLGLGIIAYGVAVCLAIVLSAHWTIPFLYGSEFDPSISILQAAVWALVPGALGGVISSLAIIGRAEWVPLVATFVAAGANVSLNSLWIPPHGAVGAAWATNASHTISLLLSIICLWIAREKRAGLQEKTQ